MTLSPLPPLYLLHAPDFLGCTDALQMAKVGTEIVTLLSSREIHPITGRRLLSRLPGCQRAGTRRRESVPAS